MFMASRTSAATNRTPAGRRQASWLRPVPSARRHRAHNEATTTQDSAPLARIPTRATSLARWARPVIPMSVLTRYSCGWSQATTPLATHTTAVAAATRTATGRHPAEGSCPFGKYSSASTIRPIGAHTSPLPTTAAASQPDQLPASTATAAVRPAAAISRPTGCPGTPRRMTTASAV
jgi:hypothetical protein